MRRSALSATVVLLLVVSATAEEGTVIMGLRHRRHATEGVQFHPESILTPVGRRLLRNFLAGANG